MPGSETNALHRLDFVLQWADTSLILGQRLGEWCGHGPILEQDIAMTNIALDYIGEARSLYQYAAQLEGAGRTEDGLAFLRDTRDFKNLLLVELPNGDFARTVLRICLYEAFHVPWLSELQNSPDATLAAVAGKSVKEARYHWQWSSEWVIRLGDGTDESKRRIEKALFDLWPYCGELTKPSTADEYLAGRRIAPELAPIEQAWRREVGAVLAEATLALPDFDDWMQLGGKEGNHTEYLGYVLTEMQYLPRAYPGNAW